MTDSQIIKKLIDVLFEKREIRNQSDFAQKTGTGTSLISQIISGRKPMTAETIEKIIQTFPQVNKLFLKGKSDRVFTDVYYRGNETVNEPLPPYGDLKDQLLTAKDKIIKLVEENSYLKTKLQDCEAELERRGFINQ